MEKEGRWRESVEIPCVLSEELKIGHVKLSPPPHAWWVNEKKMRAAGGICRLQIKYKIVERKSHCHRIDGKQFCMYWRQSRNEYKLVVLAGWLAGQGRKWSTSVGNSEIRRWGGRRSSMSWRTSGLWTIGGACSIMVMIMIWVTHFFTSHLVQKFSCTDHQVALLPV